MTRLSVLHLLWPLFAAAGLACTAASAGPGAELAAPGLSSEARYVADWVLASRDHAGRPFIVVDKLQARVFVFDGGGTLKGTAPALVGLAAGDESVPGIGERAIAAIRPEERTTPAGRFDASLERNLHGDEILWLDYEAGVALHPVIATVVKERRLARLASLAASEHRITYGCINVPVKFFADVVAPLFRGGPGVIYVLPETHAARETFGPHDAGPARVHPAPHPPERQ